MFHIHLLEKEMQSLFLHGFLGNKKVWTPFVNYFKRNYHVITIDLPGHGNTSIIEEEMTMEFSAKLIKQILKTEDILNRTYRWALYGRIYRISLC